MFYKIRCEDCYVLLGYSAVQIVGSIYCPKCHHDYLNDYHTADVQKKMATTIGANPNET